MLALSEKKEREQKEREIVEQEELREQDDERQELREIAIDPHERLLARRAYRRIAGGKRFVNAVDLQALVHILGLALSNEEAARTARALSTPIDGEEAIPWSRFLRWWAAVQDKVQ